MSLLRSRRSIHFFTSSRYAGCGVTTSSAFIRSIGTILRMPVIGLALRSPTIFSSSVITCLTSEFLSVNTPADMPAIQSMSNMSIVSIRWRSSRSVPDRISMLRSSSGRTACASFANGSSSRSISRTPT